MMLSFRQTVPVVLALLVLSKAEDVVVPESGVADPQQEPLPVLPTKQDSSYGVDCSFPIHNLDFQNGNSCGNLLGDRFSLYKDFMKGCREQFGHRCDDIEEDRVEQMLRQPRSLVNYTATGFKKIRAPAYLFALLENHWLLNKNNNEEDHVEFWAKGYTYVNYWQANTTYYGLMEPKVGGSEELQQKIFDLAKPIIEEWTGMELQPTSLYGIR
jgi:prolyl 4-hydroxylase